jgi:amino acid transporter
MRLQANGWFPRKEMRMSTLYPAGESQVAAEKKTDEHLRGNLGIPSLVFSVMAFNAPVVTFLAFIPVAIALGDGVGTPVAFLFCGVIIALFAVGFTMMARTLPNPGGFYAYITAGLGRVIGLGSSFIAVACYYFALIGSYPLAGVALNSIVHGILHGPDIPWWIWGAALFVVISVLGYFRIDVSAKILTVFLVCELILIVAYDLSVLVQGGAHGFGLTSFTPHAVFSGSTGLALMFGVGLFGGFEATIIFRDEVRKPKRTIPLATYTVIAIVAILFALTAWVFVNAYGPASVVAAATNNMTGASTASIQAYTGHAAFICASIMLFTSTFALLLSAHNITARYVYNLSADRIVHRALSRVHPKHGSPHRASIAVSIASVVGLLPFIAASVNPSTAYAELVGIFSYTLIFLLAATGIAVPIYMRRNRIPEATWWNSLVAPAISFVMLFIALILATKNFTLLIGGSQSLADLLLGLIYGVFILGVTMALIYRKKRPEIYARIGRQ